MTDDEGLRNLIQLVFLLQAEVVSMMLYLSGRQDWDPQALHALQKQHRQAIAAKLGTADRSADDAIAEMLRQFEGRVH